MSKSDRAKKRQLKRAQYAKPSLPRVIGANDNIATANDNLPEVRVQGMHLTPGQKRRYQIALRNLEHADLEVQRAGHVALEALNREITANLAKEDTAAHIEQRRGLEALRGMEIGVSKVEGAVGAHRLHTDGLETMLTAGSITQLQHAAGMLYRADYERIDPERKLTPPQLDPEKVQASHGGENWDAKRREIEDRVFTVKLMICGVEAPRSGERRALPRLPAGHPAMRAIHALDEVAGKGRIIAYMSKSGSVRARIRDDLTFALDACEIVYGLG